MPYRVYTGPLLSGTLSDVLSCLKSVALRDVYLTCQRTGRSGSCNKGLHALTSLSILQDQVLVYCLLTMAVARAVVLLVILANIMSWEVHARKCLMFLNKGLC